MIQGQNPIRAKFDIKALFSGMLSLGTSLFIVIFIFLFCLLFLIIKNLSVIPHATFAFYITLFCCFLALGMAIIKAFLFKNLAGPPEIYVNDQSRQIAFNLINCYQLQSVVQELLKLPAPVGEIQGKAEENQIRLFTEKEKSEWIESNKKDIVAQVVAEIAKAPAQKQLEEDVASEEKVAAESNSPSS